MSLFIYFIAGVALGQAFRFFPVSSLALSACLVVAAARSRPWLGLVESRVLHVALLLLVALWGFAHASLSPPRTSLDDLRGATVEIEGAVLAEGMPAGQGEGLFLQAVRVRAARRGDGSQAELGEVRVMTTVALLPGASYRIIGRVPRDTPPLNPGSAARTPTVYASEAVPVAPPSRFALSGVSEFFARSRAAINECLRRSFSDRTASFLMSQVTGERRFMTQEVREAFNATGLAHLLSISGTHFGLLFLVLFRVSRFLVRCLPRAVLVRMTAYVTPSQIGAILCFPLMVWYLGISDTSIPAVRSFIMITCFLAGLLLQRKGLWLNTLLIAAACITLSDPSAIADLSFQLSFIAVLCIGMAVDRPAGTETRNSSDELPVPREIPEGPSARGGAERPSGLTRALGAARKMIVLSLAVSLAATAGTALLVAYHFHYLSLLSPLTNLLITPFIGFVVLPVALMSSFVFMVTGRFPFTGILEQLTDWALTTVIHAGGWSFADVKIPGFPPALLLAFYGGLFAYIALSMARHRGSSRQPSPEAGKVLSGAALTASVLPLVIYGAALSVQGDGLRVTCLDVGQGDASVVELPDGRTLVIDAGRRGVQVGDFLRYRGKSSIDVLVLTHGQSDHVGGVRYLADHFSIAEVWDNGHLAFADTLQGRWVRRVLSRGDVIEGTGYRIAVLHPYEGFYTALGRGGAVNNDSLVIRVSGKEASFLFTGDIEREAQEDLAHLGERLRSTVLKVPHHGSRSALSEDFFRSVAPELAVVSAGRDNPYGFPHREVVEALGAVTVLRTDLDGAVGFREDSGGRLSVSTWRRFQLTEAGSFSEEAENLKRLLRAW